MCDRPMCFKYLAHTGYRYAAGHSSIHYHTFAYAINQFLPVMSTIGFTRTCLCCASLQVIYNGYGSEVSYLYQNATSTREYYY